MLAWKRVKELCGSKNFKFLRPSRKIFSVKMKHDVWLPMRKTLAGQRLRS